MSGFYVRVVESLVPLSVLCVYFRGLDGMHMDLSIPAWHLELECAVAKQLQMVQAYLICLCKCFV